MRYLGEEFRHFHCQILRRSLELWTSVRCQFSTTQTFVFVLGECILLQASNEIIDHLSYLLEALIWSGTRWKSAPLPAQVLISQFHDHFQFVIRLVELGVRLV